MHIHPYICIYAKYFKYSEVKKGEILKTKHDKTKKTTKKSLCERRLIVELNSKTIVCKFPPCPI